MNAREVMNARKWWMHGSDECKEVMNAWKWWMHKNDECMEVMNARKWWMHGSEASINVMESLVNIRNNIKNELKSGGLHQCSHYHKDVLIKEEHIMLIREPRV